MRQAYVHLTVDGDDGFHLNGGSSIAKISRDPADLVKQMIGPHHQYPDGAPLFLGIVFSPIQDRDTPGKGFTHKTDDIVTVSSEKLVYLINPMRRLTDCPPWIFGSSHLFRNLANAAFFRIVPSLICIKISSLPRWISWRRRHP